MAQWVTANRRSLVRPRYRRGHGQAAMHHFGDHFVRFCPADKGFVISLYNRMVCLPAISVLVASDASALPCPTGHWASGSSAALWGHDFPVTCCPTSQPRARFDLDLRKRQRAPTGMRNAAALEEPQTQGRSCLEAPLHWSCHHAMLPSHLGPRLAGLIASPAEGT